MSLLFIAFTSIVDLENLVFDSADVVNSTNWSRVRGQAGCFCWIDFQKAEPGKIQI